jgi:glutathione synthase/RimK-type ligase-like ATP-grasp enzyme
MSVLFVVNHARDWPFDIEGTRVISARDYLVNPAYSEQSSARIVNLCRTDRYQGRGYYVSLLAEARGHRAIPDVKLLGDLQSRAFDAVLGSAFVEPLQRALESHADPTCTVDCWFGRDPHERHHALAQQLFAALQIPLCTARFRRDDGTWTLDSVHIVSPNDVPPEWHPLLRKAAAEYVQRGADSRVAGRTASTPAIAILFDGDEPEPPSNRAALDKFTSAARALGMRAEVIGRQQVERLAEFDALFIRDTTNVNHYTYAFARRAAAGGLIVVDDPDSIVKCTNKVYLHELLARHRVPVPKTLTVHRDNIDAIVPALGLPLILKQPDSAFSRGVAKIDTVAALREHLDRLLGTSELIVAQQWLPTPFDWRVGVFDRRPLFVCRYYMAKDHWQVVKHEQGRRVEGSTECLSVGEAPEIVVRTAVRAANLIGDGLYGVDLKQVGDQCVVIEINDNPNIDAGNEDGVLKDALYREVMGVFLRRIRDRRPGRAP